MRSRLRSLTGFLIAAGLIPVLSGVLACLPVPIGDPERSQIDPRLTGLWATWEDEWGFMLMEPYDARTWLVTQVRIILDRGDSCDGVEYPDDYDAMIERLEADGTCLSADEVGIYKAWRSQQGGRSFLTMEVKGLINTEEEAAGLFDPLVWFVQRIDLQDPEHLTLRLIDEDFDGFDGIPETRKAYEEVIGRHADDEDLYLDLSQWVRVQDEDARYFAALLKTVLHEGF